MFTAVIDSLIAGAEAQRLSSVLQPAASLSNNLPGDTVLDYQIGHARKLDTMIWISMESLP